MDALTNAAARALAQGDPLGALSRVALRDDAPALALRGIAMAQLGDLAAAADLLARAIRGFGQREPLARARCVVARAEVALARRELTVIPDLTHAIALLDEAGDHGNAIHARVIGARMKTLLGDLEGARTLLSGDLLTRAPPSVRAIGELVTAEGHLRALEVGAARVALARAAGAAEAAGIPALQEEVQQLETSLRHPAARVLRDGESVEVSMIELEALHESEAFVVDRCRHRAGPVSLATRPVLFGLVSELAMRWPADVARSELLVEVFGQRRVTDSLRARLRVEVGRLRKAVARWAAVEATADGYRLVPQASAVVVVSPLQDGESGAVLGLLSDGASWSTSALALALGVSQRTVQRVLRELGDEGRVEARGRGRARRWVCAPLGKYATALLLPGTGHRR